jgi:hypothetical protein
MKSNIHRDIDFNGMMKFMKLSIETYSENYEKYINVTKDYNIDLFFCDTLANDVCLDAAHTLKKPVIGFSSSIYCNYKIFTYNILFLLEEFIK